jgi:CelD/BcsL family acetyltransferase involved in cellulose biosynthesis
MSRRPTNLASSAFSLIGSGLPVSTGAGVEGIDALSEDWDGLADRLAAAPFLRPGWIAAWWRAFGRGRLEVLTARDGDSLDALLPVAMRYRAATSPTNYHTPEFALLQIGAASGVVLAAELFARGSGLVSLRFLRRSPNELDVLTAAADAARYRILVRTDARLPFVRINGDWSSYERALSGNLRRDIGRCKRGLRRWGAVRLEVSNTTAALPEAFAIESAGWKGARKTAMASRPKTARFYTEIAEWAARRDSLRLIFLRVDDRAIAFHLAIEEGGAYFPLKGGFDPAFRAYSPGKLIIHATLERAFALGLVRYEFLGGEEDYKRRWATGLADRLVFQAFGPTVTGRVTRAGFAYGRPLAIRALDSIGASRS